MEKWSIFLKVKKINYILHNRFLKELSKDRLLCSQTWRMSQRRNNNSLRQLDKKADRVLVPERRRRRRVESMGHEIKAEVRVEIEMERKNKNPIRKRIKRSIAEKTIKVGVEVEVRVGIYFL